MVLEAPDMSIGSADAWCQRFWRCQMVLEMLDGTRGAGWCQMVLEVLEHHILLICLKLP